MSSPLSSMPVDKRKQFAATLGLFASLFVAVGAVAATGPGTAFIRTFVVVALVVGLLLALMAWGIVQSVRGDLAASELDAVIEQAVAANPKGFGQLCDCGHQHDPTELHITDAEPPECGHDGAGVQCTHDCESCVLTALRPSPTLTRAERRTS